MLHSAPYYFLPRQPSAFQLPPKHQHFFTALSPARGNIQKPTTVGLLSKAFHVALILEKNICFYRGPIPLRQFYLFDGRISCAMGHSSISVWYCFESELLFFLLKCFLAGILFCEPLSGAPATARGTANMELTSSPIVLCSSSWGEQVCGKHMLRVTESATC